MIVVIVVVVVVVVVVGRNAVLQSGLCLPVVQCHHARSKGFAFQEFQSDGVCNVFEKGNPLSDQHRIHENPIFIN